ncbi:hypothetical protein MRX96_049059, partial [Rhipicephalus microplus]
MFWLAVLTILLPSCFSSTPGVSEKPLGLRVRSHNKPNDYGTMPSVHEGTYKRNKEELAQKVASGVLPLEVDLAHSWSWVCFWTLTPSDVVPQAPSLDLDLWIWTLMWVHGLVVCCCFPRAHTALPFIRDLNPALGVAFSVSSRRYVIVLSGIITCSFPYFRIIYVCFGGASDPLAYNSAALITLPEAGVGLVG